MAHVAHVALGGLVREIANLYHRLLQSSPQVFAFPGPPKDFIIGGVSPEAKPLHVLRLVSVDTGERFSSLLEVLLLPGLREVQGSDWTKQTCCMLQRLD